MNGKKFLYFAALAVTLGVGIWVMYSIWGAIVPQTPAQFVESGKQYLKEKKNPEAIVEFLNALQKDPRNREARLLLSQVYTAQNEPVSAAKQLQTLLEYYPDDPEASVALGNVYLLGGREDAQYFRQSKELAEKVLAKNPQNVSAMILLGNALVGLQDYASSVEQFERALQLDPQNASTLVSLGASEAVQKNFPEAEKSFLKAREVDPKNPAAMVSLGNFYRAVGKVSEAEAIFKEALSLFPTDPEIYRTAIQFYFQSNRFGEVERVLKEVQDKTSTDPSPSLTLVDFYRSQRREADATALLRDLKKKFPKDRKVSLALAANLLEDEPATARAEIDALLKTNPQDVEARVLLGELQFKEKHYDQAVATLNVPSILSGRYPRAHMILGLIEASNGQTDKALDRFKSSLDLDPTYTPTRLSLAELLLRLGRNADADIELKKVLAVQPTLFEARLLKAALDTVEKRFVDAERELTALQKEQPDNALVHLRTGLYYQIRGMTANAEKSLLRALALQPDSEDILTNVASFYMVQQKTDQAIKVIQDTVPDERKTAFHYGLMGRVYSGARRSSEAETAFKKAIQLDPGFLQARADLANEYIVVKRFDEALVQIDAFLKENPENPRAYMTKGMIFEAKGNLDEAMENYSRSLKLNPEIYIAANNLAFLLAQEDRDLEVALNWAQTARRLQPNEASSADTLGWVQYKLGRYVLAREQLQFAVLKSPENPVFQYHLAMIYKDNKQTAEAEKALRKALASKRDFKDKPLAESALKELTAAK